MNSCIFCQIIEGSIPAKKVLETKDLIVLNDLHPKAPVHLLLIPKKHTSSPDTTDGEFFEKIPSVLNELIKSQPLLKQGYRLVINNGASAGQEIEHLHVHVLAGKQLGPMC